MKSLIITILFLAFVFSCSRQGSTTSKIKISGAGIFSGSFGTTASNGMILYGKSSDGKNFTKILDADSTDLEFPNGIWSFFAVAWDNTGAGTLNNFNGTRKCGASEGVALNGADTTINISLTTTGCNNFAFYSPRVTTCRNDGLVNADSTSLCSQGNKNKGYGTWMRIAVPEMKNFSQGSLTISGNALRSFCVKISGTTSDGAEATDAELALNATNLTALNIPKDVMATTEVFYSETACDGSYGVDTYVVGGPKAIFYDNSSIRRIYVETNESDVCKNERLSKPFASGFGTTKHPFTICTPTQWNNIGTNFATLYTNSFELLSNIDFNMGHMLMIGQQSGSTTAFTGNFEGNNHFVSNAQLACPSGATSDSGIFRSVDGTSSLNTISNITFNAVLNFCGITNNTGGVIGSMTNTTLDNIKYFGALEGESYVGGLVGKITVNQSSAQNYINNSHVNAHVNGKQYVGGIFGYGTMSGTLNLSAAKMSFKGELRAHDSSTLHPLSYVGGIAGYIDSTGTTSSKVAQSVVVADVIEGARIIGGVIGSAIQTSVEDSYVRTSFNENANSTSTFPVNLGGIVGLSSSTVSILRSFSMMSYANLNTNGTDYTYGGLVGSGTTTCTNSFWVGNSAYSHASNSQTMCNAGSVMTVSNSKLFSNYTGYSASGFWVASTDGYDYPRLAWESSEEGKVSYLKRDCIGSSMFQTTPTGSGTLLDPYLICTTAHFQNMNADSVYVLKNDLNFSGNTFTPRPVGKYTLYGDAHIVKDLFITLQSNDNSGIFKTLNSGSLIKNIKFKGVNVSTSGASGIVNATAGTIAGINNGDILKVNVDSSKLNILTGDFNVSGNPVIVLGGAVGINTGKVTGEVTSNVKISDINSTTNVNSSIYLGGVIGKNNGTLSATKSHSEVRFDSSALSYDLTANTNIGHAAAYNDGIIQQLELDGTVSVNNNVSGTVGNVGVIVGQNLTLGAVIRDINVRTRLDHYLFAPPTYKLIPDKTAGSVTKRIIFTPNGDAIVSTSILMSNVTDSLCVMSSPITGCHQDTLTTFNSDSTFGFHVQDNGSPVLDVADWNVAYGLSLDTARVWRNQDAISDTDWVNKSPEVISASGSLEKLGEPFN